MIEKKTYMNGDHHHHHHQIKNSIDDDDDDNVIYNQSIMKEKQKLFDQHEIIESL